MSDTPSVPPRVGPVRSNTVALAAAAGGIFLVMLGAFTLYRLNVVERQVNAQTLRLARLESVESLGAPAAKIVQMAPSQDWIALGRADAPVTVVEFADYECPFCRQFHQQAYADIVQRYVDSGKVRWVSRDLPLLIHPYAAKAAEATHCAGEQGKFWEFRSVLLSSEETLSRRLVREAGNKLSLDGDSLLKCVDAGKYRARVANDIADARVLQIDGTPAFVIAKTSSDILSGPLIVGMMSFADFQARIDSLIRN